MNSPVDMAQFIAPKSDQINADDLIGGPLTIRVSHVSANESAPEQPININFDGDEGKPFRPCKSMRRVMVHIWGADASKYVGRSMTLYRDPKVQFGGMQVGGIRISHMSDIPPEKLSDGRVQMALTATRAKRAPYAVLPLKDAPKQAGNDEAQQWADKFIVNVGRAPTLEKLDQFVAGKAAALADLQAGLPALFAACNNAVREKRASFGGETGDSEDPFAETPADEPAAPPVNYSGFVNGIEARILNATTPNELDAIAEDIGAADHLPEAEVEKLDALVAKKRRALK